MNEGVSGGRTPCLRAEKYWLMKKTYYCNNHGCHVGTTVCGVLLPPLHQASLDDTDEHSDDSWPLWETWFTYQGPGVATYCDSRAPEFIEAVRQFVGTGSYSLRNGRYWANYCAGCGRRISDHQLFNPFNFEEAEKVQYHPVNCKFESYSGSPELGAAAERLFFCASSTVSAKG